MRKLSNQKGIFITLEGIDGCGKSTLAANVAAALEADGLPVLLTKEPGGSALGIALRQILQEQDQPLEAVSEFLLFAADRAEHFRKVIIPALGKGIIVISDRCADSSLAYQGYGRGVDTTFISQVNAIAMADISPTLTIFIDIEPEVAFARFTKRGEQLTAFEARGIPFLATVRQGFEAIFKSRNNVLRLDGNETQEILLARALEGLKEVLPPLL